MTTQEIKNKYPESIKMIDNLNREVAVHEIRGNRTVHKSDDGTYYYNYEGVHLREFKDLEHLVKWFFGSQEEQQEAETQLKEFFYSERLSQIKDAEVWLDEDNKVSERYCDFTNDDFNEIDLKIAATE